MGCDIHMVVQVRKEGQWESVKMVDAAFGIDSWASGEPTYQPYSIRSYDVFAMLANVRNGRGFAGCDTGDGFLPIGDQRGLPDDFTPPIEYDEYYKDDREVWMGDHSFTWVTLAELESYTWGLTTKQRGWINGTELKRMRESGDIVPKTCCGSIVGRHIQHVSIQELDRRIQDEPEQIGVIALNDISKLYALYEWEQSYKDCAGIFYEKFIPALRELGKPEDVRLVMGFDS